VEVKVKVKVKEALHPRARCGVAHHVAIDPGRAGAQACVARLRPRMPRGILAYPDFVPFLGARVDVGI
jgi:hypothetical protein